MEVEVEVTGMMKMVFQVEPQIQEVVVVQLVLILMLPQLDVTVVQAWFLFGIYHD
jgi:hypothetical protein